MRRAHAAAWAFVIALAITISGCTSNADRGATSSSGEPLVSHASPSPTEDPGFLTEAFAEISEDAVSEKQAKEFQKILDDIAWVNDAGMSATVMTADGTWSGATGSADGVRGVQVDSQFGIASITKKAGIPSR